MHCNTAELICNVQFDDTGWKQAKLPVDFGGFGLRSAGDLALPGYLSACESCRHLISATLPPPSEPSVENADNVITTWTSSDITIPDDPVRQSNWDSLLCSAQVAALKPISNQHRQACFVVVTCMESGAWLNCLPSTAIGCRLDNDSFCLAVSIRHGLRVCTPHRCRCYSRVNKYGLHPLSRRFSIGHLPRHTALNDVTRRSLQSADIPAPLKPAGSDRDDGNRLDGITLFPYTRGKSLVMDATCTDTFSPSNMIRSAIHPRAAANEAESRKRSKYASLTDRFDFQPIAVETSRVFGNQRLSSNVT